MYSEGCIILKLMKLLALLINGVEFNLYSSTDMSELVGSTAFQWFPLGIT